MVSKWLGVEIKAKNSTVGDFFLKFDQVNNIMGRYVKVVLFDNLTFYDINAKSIKEEFFG